ncbi:GNAT family N-acetyltransferase [Streptomyces sp. O3]
MPPGRPVARRLGRPACRWPGFCLQVRACRVASAGEYAHDRFDRLIGAGGRSASDAAGRGRRRMNAVVTDAETAQRFEARVDGVLAGFAEYLRTDALVVYPHTEVDPAYEGQGVGGALARAALDDARERGLRVLATCPFVSGWLARHPEYQDLAYQSRSRATD